MSIYKATTDVAQPPAVLWSILSDASSWENWWGGPLASVDPRWTKGALMRWELGSPSEVREFDPTRTLSFSNPSGTICTIAINEGAPGSSTLTYTEDLTQSRLTVTDPGAVRGECQRRVDDLKRFAEANADRYSASAADAQPQVSSPLAGLLEDLQAEGKGMRLAAVQGLGETGDAAAIEPLVAAMGDKEEDVRHAAANALDQIGWDPDTDELRARHLIALRQWDKCLQLGPAGVRALIRVNQLQIGRYTNDPTDKAMRVLAQAGPDAVPPLVEALQDDDNWTAAYAAETLGAIGHPSAADGLLAALEHPFPYIRKAAAEALGQVGDERAFEPLIKALEDPETRLAAVRGLGWLADGRALATLLGLTKDPDQTLRATVVEALGRIGDPRAFDALTAATRDDAEYVRRLAGEALQRIPTEGVEPTPTASPAPSPAQPEATVAAPAQPTPAAPRRSFLDRLRGK